MPLQNQTCQTCNSFVEYIKRGLGVKSGPTGRGECRRFPPLSSGHRKVDNAYWCQEWSPIEEGRHELHMRPLQPIGDTKPSPNIQHGQHQSQNLQAVAPVEPTGGGFPGQKEHLLQRGAELQGRIQMYVQKIERQKCLQRDALDERARLEEKLIVLRKELDEIREQQGFPSDRA